MTALARFTAVALAGILASGASADPNFWRHEWPDTDFSRTSVPWIEILSGGPPKDGIPAVMAPKMIAVSAETRLAPAEPVMTLEMDGETPRAYPIRYLMWHEIANDRVGGVPVTVTFCPLCNSGLIFDGRLGGREYTFGVTGKLRNSDMVMYDHQTESWWQQFDGEAIVGAMLGQELVTLPSWMESWAEYAARNPEGLVMDQPGQGRSYGTNPYARYDSSARPFLYNGEMPPHGIEPLARVLRIGATAWPLERLAREGEVREKGVVITWKAGTASALDTAEIGQGRDVGSIRVKDAAGQDVPHEVVFAFAFHAFEPQGEWMLGN